MVFADLHRHLLPGLDDGAASEEDMKRMLDDAYAEGVRLLCATPHFHPGFFPYSEEKRAKAYAALEAYAAGKYPELTLFPGAELRYADAATEWLSSGICPTLAGSSCVLVDFLPDVSAEVVMTAMRKLLNEGYLPLLAHVERYPALEPAHIEELKSMGVRLQLDAGSLFGEWGVKAKARARRLIRFYRADVVGSDAHRPESKICSLPQAYRLAARLSDETYAEALFYRNPYEILTGGKLPK